MLGFLKRKKKATNDESSTSPQPLTDEMSNPGEPNKPGLFKRLTAGLHKTRKTFSDGMATALLGKKEINDDILEEVETQLLMADVGVEATQMFIDNLHKRLSRKSLDDAEAVLLALKEDMTGLLNTVEQPLQIHEKKPFVILMVGVNGAGKTTTIGKLAHYFQQQGKSVMLAAGDTFRAAAVEQLKTWGERNDVPVIAQGSGSDSAAVIFDAMASAKARNVDVLIADTAGRLHNKDNLMEELKKIKRVMQKQIGDAPHETLLVIDAGNGQNALSQATQFNQAIDISGICLTKLDGTAKGGIIFAIAKQIKKPLRFIGVGEQIDDLRPFQGTDFIEALFADQ
ncbi:MAG: signal recognition particle-docking protein FtsY [Legionellaceae bacterium]|nr:signal recognition particle-docking protein FtsY [Legionellaceae bacterium]